MKCPGQDMKHWKADAIFEVDCPKCGSLVEFYKDDTSRTCHKCVHRFVNPKLDFGCASYCQFAEQCLGTLPEDFTGALVDLLKDKVAVEVKRYYHTDFKAIRIATSGARHAEAIGKGEGGNLPVILCSTYLYGIENEIAKTILLKVGATPEMSELIQNIISSSSSDETTKKSLEAKIVSDALMISNIQDMIKSGGHQEDDLQQMVEQLETETARTLANTI